jgi:AcrR family transcriptional regulator
MKPAPGLRERKKAKTRAAIQRHALRLFREQGYEATTVNQIAEAAEISPSTFFRYFPTKEDVVLYDALDPITFASFAAQPAELSPIEAMRQAIREVYAAMSPEDLQEQRERGLLIFSVPELSSRMLGEILKGGQQMAELVAERVGRPADDAAVRVFIGAVLGAALAAILPSALDPNADFVAQIDASLALLEAGLPL